MARVMLDGSGGGSAIVHEAGAMSFPPRPRVAGLPYDVRSPRIGDPAADILIIADLLHAPK